MSALALEIVQQILVQQTEEEEDDLEDKRMLAYAAGTMMIGLEQERIVPYPREKPLSLACCSLVCSRSAAEVRRVNGCRVG